MSGCRYIYAILDPKNNAVKIGKATNVKARLSGIQVGNATELELIGEKWANDAAYMERRLHRLCAPAHIRGEWFSMKHGIVRRTVLYIQGKGKLDVVSTKEERDRKREQKRQALQDWLARYTPQPPAC